MKIFFCAVCVIYGTLFNDPINQAAAATFTKTGHTTAISLGFATFLGTSGATGFSELWESVYDHAGNLVVMGLGDFDPNGYPGVPVTTFGTIDHSTIMVAKLSPDGAHLLWVTLIGGSGIEKEGDGIAIDQNDEIYVAATTYTSDFPTTPSAFQPQYKGGGDGREIVLMKLSADGKTLRYATYLGGSNHETARGGLAVDSQGDAYLVGMTASPDFLDQNGVTNPAKVNSYTGGVGDGFIVKVAPNGANIVYARFIGSPNDTLYDGDVMLGLQLDAQGSAYINGLVRGDGVLVTNDAYDKTYNGGSADVYYLKLTPDGKQVLYATYLGGSDEDDANHRMVLDSQGNVYLVGGTASADFPLRNAHDATYGGAFDGFLSKFDKAGQLVFSTYIGGTGENETLGPALDANGNLFVAAFTETGDMEVTPDAADSSDNGNRDIVLQQYTPDGQLLYSTFLGGSNFDRPRFVAAAADGNPVIVGYSQSTDFPTTPGAYDRTYNGGYDIFVAKFVVTDTPQTPPTALTLDGPTTGKPGVDYTFTASVFPLTVTQPITYVWSATGQALMTHSNGITDTAHLQWSSLGSQVITVTATSASQTAQATHVISLSTQPQPGVLNFAPTVVSVGEKAGQATITVTRINGNDGIVTVDYTTVDGEGSATVGSDYSTVAGTLTLTTGQTSATLTVSIQDDEQVEGTETVNLRLSNPTGGASLGDNNTATVQILDDDISNPGRLTIPNYLPLLLATKSTGVYADRR